MPLRTFAAFSSVIVLAAVSVGDDRIVYEQPVTSDPTPYVPGYISDAFAGQFYSQRIADNFVLDQDERVSIVEFHGLREGFSSTPGIGNVKDLDVQIWTSGDGRIPVELLHAQTVPLAETNPELAFVTFYGFQVFQHRISLSEPVALEAGREYWLTIGARLVDVFEDSWRWYVSEPGDLRIAYQRFDDQGWLAEATPNSPNVTFTLIGTSCRADLDGDGELTIFDFLEFQNFFDSGDLTADFDGDGSLTIFDFLAFQNEFDTGC